MSDYPNGYLCLLVQHLPIELQTLITWGTSLKTINVFIATFEITKTGTLATTLHKPARGANPYVRFGYAPLIIWNHTQGQVSVSMNADLINKIHTSQQSTQEGFKE